MTRENRHFYEFGPFRIDTRNRQVLRENELVPLKAKAVDTLLLLIESRWHLLSMVRRMAMARRRKSGPSGRIRRARRSSL